MIEYNQIDRGIKEDQKKKITDHFAYQKVPVQNYNILKVRDAILGLGIILEEDLQNQFYLTTVKTGFLGTNEAVAIVLLNNNVVSVAAYAPEGLINQNIANKAVEKIKNRIIR